jgi:hypothetical protein
VINYFLLSVARIYVSWLAHDKTTRLQETINILKNINSMHPIAKIMKGAWSVSPQIMVSAARIVMDGELPAKGSLPHLFNEMDYHQAIQCYLWGLPLVGLQTFKEIHEKKFGATSFDIVVYNSYQDKAGILTANIATPYVLSFIDLAKTGTVVIELPAGHIAGGLTDCWQREEIPMGETGADKGYGGKYILIPPGQKKFRSLSCYVVACSTRNMWFGFQVLTPDPVKANTLINGVKIYSYKKRPLPPKTNIIRPAGRKYYTAQPDGIDYWKTLHTILQKEPVKERDIFFIACLDNLGIKKGKPFNPTERQKKILINAAERGRLMAIAGSFEKCPENVKHWPAQKWDDVTVISDPSRQTPYVDEFLQRTFYFYEAPGYSKPMLAKTHGTGQACLAAYSDKGGRWLNGSKIYCLTIPEPVPITNFWSVTVYDVSTRCLIKNDQHCAEFSSRDNLTKNNNGSVTIYFSAEKPGTGKNWIQTIQNKHWFVYMRFYAPTQAYFDKSWVMSDVEEVRNDTMY